MCWALLEPPQIWPRLFALLEFPKGPKNGLYHPILVLKHHHNWNHGLRSAPQTYSLDCATACILSDSFSCFPALWIAISHLHNLLKNFFLKRGGPLCSLCRSVCEIQSCENSSIYLYSDMYTLYLFVAGLGLHCYTGAFSNCGEQGLLSSCTVQAAHCGGFSCCAAQAPGACLQIF